MELQPRLLLLASIAAALVVVSSRGAVVAAGANHAMMPLRGSVEDDVGLGADLGEEAVAAYPQRRVLYSPQYIGYGGLEANKAACYGSCPAQGQPYTRGCKAIYGCRGR